MPSDAGADSAEFAVRSGAASVFLSALASVMTANWPNYRSAQTSRPSGEARRPGSSAWGWEGTQFVRSPWSACREGITPTSIRQRLVGRVQYTRPRSPAFSEWPDPRASQERTRDDAPRCRDRSSDGRFPASWLGTESLVRGGVLTAGRPWWPANSNRIAESLRAAQKR